MEEGAKEPQVGGPYALADHWKLLASAVDAALEAKLGELGDGCPERLRAAIGYSLLSPGKRLRPVLCLLTCEALGLSLIHI